MSSCVTGGCGTGGFGLPMPGDPSTDGALSARSSVGGIELSFVLPTVGAFAVAYTQVYRSITNQFINAMPLVKASGDYHFDRVASDQQYWYWIEFVSVQGTVMPLIGPATAVAYDSVEQMLQELTGRIDAGKLAQALRTEIDRIPLIDLKIIKEIQDRASENQIVLDFLQEVNLANGQLVTLIQEEITKRTEGDASLVQAIEVLGVGQGDNAALIANERNLRISADEVLAQEIDTMYAAVQTDISSAITAERIVRVSAEEALGQEIDQIYVKYGDGGVAALEAERTARMNADEAIVNDMVTLYAKKEDVTAAVQVESQARTNALEAMSQTISTQYATKGSLTAATQSLTQTISDGDNALSQRIDTLQAGSGVDGTARAAIQEESQARVSADEALSSRITTLEADDGSGNLAQIEEKLTVTANKVDGVGAMYTLKTNVNGLVGGMGTYNDGNTVQVIWDVDEFIVGRTPSNGIRPFMIINGVTYINSAYISSLTVDKITSGSMNAEWRLNGANARIVIDTGTVMKVKGAGFGAQHNLIEWFGPSMPVDQCSPQNAINYETTSGDSYWGGSLRAGVLYNAQQTTSIAYNAQVPLGPFWSNGNPRSLVVSFQYAYDLQNLDMGNGGYRIEGGDPYATIQLWAGNALLREVTFIGNARVYNEIDGPDNASVDISGSFTFTHTGGAGNYQYHAVIVGRYQPNLIHNSGTSHSQDTRQTLGIVSTEE